MYQFNTAQVEELTPSPIELIDFSNKKKVPAILQSEIAECGLACVAMISSYFGHKINLQALRNRHFLDSNGTNLRYLIDVASGLGLSNRALQCDLSDIKKLSLPCILHWDMSHFVVLTGVSRKNVWINDPAFGKRMLTIAELSEHFTGIALELTPTAEFKRQDSRILMQLHQLWNRITSLKQSLLTLLALSLILQSAALTSPYYIQWVIDKTLVSNDSSLLVVLATGFLLIGFISILIGLLRSWLVLRMSSMLNIQMGANLFHHLIRLPLSYFEKRQTGDIVSRFGSLSAIQSMLTTGIVETFVDGVMSIIVLLMMLLYSVKLSAIVIVIVLLSFIVKAAFYPAIRRLTEESIQAEAQEDTTFLENIRAFQVIKIFSNEAQRQGLWLNRYADALNAEIRLSKIDLSEGALQALLFKIESILVIYFGALVVMDGDLTVGMLLAFIAYKIQFTGSINNFIDQLIEFKMLSLHLERISDIALHEQEQQDGIIPTKQATIEGNITLDNVSFAYSDDAKEIIKDLSLTIEANESVAIVGPSGCGKSTLLKIILGLLKPTKGKVLIDGVDIYQVGLKEYRRYISGVMQKDTLLTGSVADNITFFDSEADTPMMEACAQIACIHDEICKMPMGYHTLVGDMGNSFSGGQVQRLLLARSLYQEPRILCLDEATSHLDIDNESKVNENIKSMQLTKIIIAHRKETIASADRVIELG